MQPTHSDGNLIKTNDNNVGLKQKLVNKVKHWNNRESKAGGSNEYIAGKVIQKYSTTKSIENRSIFRNLLT